nr:unnamed protein product [Digitaria exilis]
MPQVKSSPDGAGGEYIKWMCGAGGRAGGAMANLQRGVGSLVRDIGDPCLNPSPVKDAVNVIPFTLVDVVRTDSHLDFYGESRNMARMSDILAVYAWVDPSTGYCQGMSDLLSPFVVIYEDDADAFWCFEMLLRRMRENFQMEGPTGVLKQLQALWKIMELTDVELFEHLSAIGAESLHFAFRMLLVLFRRELSFEESLTMWEMMWAADFDEEAIRRLEESCLESLLMFNDNVLKINVKRCVRLAIKLRKKYLYKVNSDAKLLNFLFPLTWQSLKGGSSDDKES